jgi:hypothetical protein
MDNGSAPATRQDVKQLRAEMNHGYRDLAERITDSETRVLKAFYAYAESNQKRTEQLEDTDVRLLRRIGTLEERLLQVEKRLNLPPSA